MLRKTIFSSSESSALAEEDAAVSSTKGAMDQVCLMHFCNGEASARRLDVPRRSHFLVSGPAAAPLRQGGRHLIAERATHLSTRFEHFQESCSTAQQAADRLSNQDGPRLRLRAMFSLDPYDLSPHFVVRCARTQGIMHEEQESACGRTTATPSMVSEAGSDIDEETVFEILSEGELYKRLAWLNAQLVEFDLAALDNVADGVRSEDGAEAVYRFECAWEEAGRAVAESDGRVLRRCASSSSRNASKDAELDGGTGGDGTATGSSTHDAELEALRAELIAVKADLARKTKFLEAVQAAGAVAPVGIGVVDKAHHVALTIASKLQTAITAVDIAQVALENSSLTQPTSTY